MIARNIIKTAIAIELENMGSSLENLEENLSKVNTGEGVLKVANEVSELAAKLVDLTTMGAITGGVGVGGGLLLADKQLSDIDKNIQKKKLQQQEVLRQAANLQRAQGIV